MQTVVLDVQLPWQLPPGLSLIQRDARTVQIGVEPARRILLREAPAGTLDLLRRIRGDRVLAAVLQETALRFAVPTAVYTPVLQELLEAGYLTINGDSTSPLSPGSAASSPDRAAIAAATDPQHAARLMRQRRDAVAVIVGAGRVATSLATVLATAGVGHVHVEPARSLRPSDVAPAGLGSADVPAGRRGDARRDPGADPRWNLERPRAADRDALGAMIRRVAPDTLVHPPTGYVPPSLVVLAEDGAADSTEAARLVRDRIPHLAVRASDLRGVVGPLVAPGRSSCVHCHDLHRRDLDPAWPRILLSLQRTVAVPAAVLATSTAALAAHQVLQFLDGRRMPATVDGTLEVAFDDWRVRRRSWQPHPECFCRSLVPPVPERPPHQRATIGGG